MTQQSSETLSFPQETISFNQIINAGSESNRQNNFPLSNQIYDSQLSQADDTQNKINQILEVHRQLVFQQKKIYNTQQCNYGEIDREFNQKDDSQNAKDLNLIEKFNEQLQMFSSTLSLLSTITNRENELKSQLLTTLEIMRGFIQPELLDELLKNNHQYVETIIDVAIENSQSFLWEILLKFSQYGAAKYEKVWSYVIEKICKYIKQNDGNDFNACSINIMKNLFQLDITWQYQIYHSTFFVDLLLSFNKITISAPRKEATELILFYLENFPTKAHMEILHECDFMFCLQNIFMDNLSQPTYYGFFDDSLRGIHYCLTNFKDENFTEEFKSNIFQKLQEIYLTCQDFKMQNNIHSLIQNLP